MPTINAKGILENLSRGMRFRTAEWKMRGGGPPPPPFHVSKRSAASDGGPLRLILCLTKRLIQVNMMGSTCFSLN